MFLNISIVNFFNAVSLDKYEQRRIQTTRISHDINFVFFANTHNPKKGDLFAFNQVFFLHKFIFFIKIKFIIQFSYFCCYQQKKIEPKNKETIELCRTYFQNRHDLFYLNILSQSEIFFKRHMTNSVPKEKKNFQSPASSCTIS